MINREVAILLVDDDVELCDLMREFFAARGLRVEAVHDGRRGLARALAGDHDLLLLDIMMPGLDGFELLRQVRKQRQTPVIMLTARTAQADRVAGLDAGADDYLPKPFAPEELLARIRAVLRRTIQGPRSAEVVEVGGISFVASAQQARIGDRPIPLTSSEYALLEYLARAAGRIVPRDELTAALYHRPASPFDRVLDVHVSNIRKKLGDHGRLIQTVRGTGFLFRAVPAAEDP